MDGDLNIEDILKPIKISAKQQYLGTSRYIAGESGSKNRYF